MYLITFSRYDIDSNIVKQNNTGSKITNFHNYHNNHKFIYFDNFGYNFQYRNRSYFLVMKFVGDWNPNWIKRSVS